MSRARMEQAEKFSVNLNHNPVQHFQCFN